MKDAKKLHLRMKAEQINEELYSKKCARNDCDDCPAHIPTHFIPSETDDGFTQVDIYCVCLRTVLKSFISNLKKE